MISYYFLWFFACPFLKFFDVLRTWQKWPGRACLFFGVKEARWCKRWNHVNSQILGSWWSDGIKKNHQSGERWRWRHCTGNILQLLQLQRRIKFCFTIPFFSHSKSTHHGKAREGYSTGHRHLPSQWLSSPSSLGEEDCRLSLPSSRERYTCHDQLCSTQLSESRRNENHMTPSSQHRWPGDEQLFRKVRPERRDHLVFFKPKKKKM